jgi:hypothetical protein
MRSWLCGLLAICVAVAVGAQVYASEPLILASGGGIVVSVDEAAPESDPDHNSNADADLTTMHASFKGPGPDTLAITLDFSTTWGGMHLMVALERRGDADGGVQDPFEFPIAYRQSQRPDYVFTYKYSGEDYADLRRWNSRWEFWQLVRRNWTIESSDPGKNALAMVTKTESQVVFNFPVDAIGDLSAGDTLYLEAYVTQQTPEDRKYGALDSSPHDATHDMEPDEGQWWETAEDTTYLTQYASLGIPEFGVPPNLSDAIVQPDTATVNDEVIFSVGVEDAGGGIGEVYADLSGIGGAMTALADDGTGGDIQAGDGIYSVAFTIPATAPGGDHPILFGAKDGANITERRATSSIFIVTEAVVFRTISDDLADDHGPSITDPEGDPVPGLYYHYPTNSVFKEGAFDLERADFMIDGPYLVLRLYVADVLSSEEVTWGAIYPEASCSNPNKAELNLPKIDVYIDAVEGVGSTVGFPKRYVGIAQQDAWEYGVAIEGWYKGLVASNGSNDMGSWTISKQISKIDVCNDHIENYIDILIGLEAVGSPTTQEIEQWDFMITMASHDGDSNDGNLGGIRWVNADTGEWQFGGGANSEGSRDRDANVIDVLTVPGKLEVGGRLQRDMLNYLLPDAMERFDQGLASCVVEATPENRGIVTGTVTLSDPSDASTIATVEVLIADEVYGWGETGPGGGSYIVGNLPDGIYDVVARARTYRVGTEEGVVIAGGARIEDIDFDLERVTGAIMGSVAVDGPPADVRVYAEDTSTGAIAGEGEKTVPGGTGSFEILIVEDGTYEFFARGRGYATYDTLVTIAGGDTAYIDAVLYPTLATRYVFVDDDGNPIYSDVVTVSIPDSGIYYYADLVFEAQDDDGNVASLDPSAGMDVALKATLLDTAVPPRGNVVFADNLGNEIAGGILPPELFTDGVGTFSVLDDSLEVLRLEVGKPQITGTVELWVKEIEPKRVRLTPDKTEIVADGVDQIEVAVQLLDDIDNPIPVHSVEVQLIALEGEPIFEPEIDITDGNGFFKSLLYGFRAGTVRVTALALFNNQQLGADTVEVVLNPGPPSDITADLRPATVERGREAQITYQVVDANANHVPVDSVGIDLSAYPPDVLASYSDRVFTGTDGRAVASLVAGDAYGFATVRAEVEEPEDLPVEVVTLSIAPARLVSQDEAAPESDPAHNSLPDVDLTNMYAWLRGDTLNVAVDFTSPWDAVHLMVALEKNGDRAGGGSDPFEFPINYRHTYRPDYVFTYKYSSQDYADLRRWNDVWEFWYLDTGIWSSEEIEGQNKNATAMITRTASQVIFKFPVVAIGETEPFDTLRLQSYVTQEPFGQKYNALDSNPHDNTHDMEPDDGSEWYETALSPVSLSKYGELVVPPFGVPPALSYPKVSLPSASPGEGLLLSVAVRDSGGGIGDVFADLAAIGGEATSWLFDDGSHGDTEAGDGTYSGTFTLPTGITQGKQPIGFAARDSLNVAVNRVSVNIEIITLPEPFVTVEDAAGDDHGPDSLDFAGNPVEGLYYFYPTNGVFAEGVFDLERVDLAIDGIFLVIRLKVGEIPSSEAVGWNAPEPVGCEDPYKADLNLQKVDIYIDSEEGKGVGATAGLPSRYIDIANNDAWEYAIAIEGWWRGLVASNGENASAFWDISKQTGDISFCTDHRNDLIEIKVSLNAIGVFDSLKTPTPDDIERAKREIKKWDFIITMTSHDGDSDDENQGGVRWVNKATSEWNFGGGRDGEAGRERDANIMDIVTIPGEGKKPGRGQTGMLNYLTEAAQRRFNQELTACVVEATFSEDVSPPIVTPFARDGFAHRPWRIMEHSPAAFWTMIEDESDIEEVVFLWRPLGRSDWNTVEMGNIVGDYWVTDIEPDELAADVKAVELVDGNLALPFEAEIYARDVFKNEGKSEFFTFAVTTERLPYQIIRNVGPGDVLITYDGTFVIMPEALVTSQYDSLRVKITPLAETGPESVDLANIRPSMEYQGVGRRIEMTSYSAGEATLLTGLRNNPIVALHYPSYFESPQLDEKRIGLFHYNDLTQRWIRIGGSVNDWGNAVRAEMDRFGTFGLFTDTDISYAPDEGLSGVFVEPNPFSPNGDGLYDETRISFFVSRALDWVTIEIFDISGEEVRTIRWQEGLSSLGRNEVRIMWDGRDDNGNMVPYGIYIMRVEAQFKVEPRYERQNIAVVVIK